MNKKSCCTRNCFELDFFEKKIIGTAARFNRASKGLDPEYSELVKWQTKHSDFTLKIKNTITNKQTYHGLTREFIFKYIEIFPEHELYRNKLKVAEELVAGAGNTSFPTLKKEFLDLFSTEDKPFDWDEAQKKYKAYYAQKATDEEHAKSSSKNVDLQMAENTVQLVNQSNLPLAANQ